MFQIHFLAWLVRTEIKKKITGPSQKVKDINHRKTHKYGQDYLSITELFNEETNMIIDLITDIILLLSDSI